MSTPWIVAFVALACLGLGTAVLVLGLFKRTIVVLQGLEHQLQSGMPAALSPGTRLPEFRMRDASGNSVGSDRLELARGVLLFLSSTCGPCRSLVDELGSSPEAELVDRLTVILQDDDDQFGRSLSGFRIWRDHTAFTVLNVTATPYAIGVGKDLEVIASMVPGDVLSLQELTRSVGRSLGEEVDVASTV